MFSKLKRRVNGRSRRFNMEYTIEIIFMNTLSVFGGLYEYLLGLISNQNIRTFFKKIA